MRRLSFSFLLLLSACASTVTMDQATNSSLATVMGQIDRTQGFTNWRSFVLLSVDDKPVSHAYLSDRRDTVVKVSAGEHKFVVEAAFNTGMGNGGPWEAIVLVRSNVEAGHAYRVNGQVRDTSYYVWLEEAQSGAKVSDEYSASYAKSRPAPTTIPVFIPAR